MSTLFNYDKEALIAQ